MSSLHPVDELAEVRAQLLRLQAREHELITGFLRGDHGLAGLFHQAEVRTTRRRVFAQDQLPPGILNDPRMWSEVPTRLVTVRALAGADLAHQGRQVASQAGSLTDEAAP